MSFGYALRKFREDRNLSLREFGKLCAVDHAYIHRSKGTKRPHPPTRSSTLSSAH